jgi:hypothetical protein
MQFLISIGEVYRLPYHHTLLSPTLSSSSMRTGKENPGSKFSVQSFGTFSCIKSDEKKPCKSVFLKAYFKVTYKIELQLKLNFYTPFLKKYVGEDYAKCIF